MLDNSISIQIIEILLHILTHNDNDFREIFYKTKIR